MTHSANATTSPAHWLAKSEANALDRQKVLDDFDSAALSLNPPDKPFQLDAGTLRLQLIAERDEYQQEAAYWRTQLTGIASH